MTVTLMRHPEVERPEGLCSGRTEVPLSVAGEASLVGLTAMAAGLFPCRVLSSDSGRCRRLADEVAGKLGLVVEVDPVWREINFGAWENRLWEEIRECEPEAVAAWGRDFVETVPPGGSRSGRCRSVFWGRCATFRVRAGMF